ncbi:DUF2997 domain-containing protein [Mariniblastus sp.]|nr:DUF2997 domain-containing protein [Mariniblastus sp.]
MNKRIEIVVDPHGNSKVETKGFAGSECTEASKFIEQALGMQTSKRTTAEFYAPAEVGVQRKHQAT